jgi:IS30 family transposase
MKQKMIAQEIGVLPSTISRELKRNTAKRDRTADEYSADNAQRKMNQRHQLKPKVVKFTHPIK